MSSPQTEDGYVRIANELLEAILRHPLSKRELLVVMAIIRKTYGFNKKSDDMSGQQIANLTGLKRQHVSVCVCDLSRKNIVLKRDGQYGQVLGINKKYSEWLLVPKQDTLVPNQDMSQNRTPTSPKSGLVLVPNQDIQKTTPKDTIKRQDDGHQNAPVGLNVSAWDSYAAYRKESKLRSLKPVSVLRQQAWLVEQGPPDVQQRVVDETIRNNWQGLFALKGENNGSHQKDSRSRAQRVNDKLQEIARRDDDAGAMGGGIVCEASGALSAQVDFGD